jgi:hypothetical protein
MVELIVFMRVDPVLSEGNKVNPVNSMFGLEKRALDL